MTSHRSTSNFDIKELYVPEDIAGSDFTESVGFPGQFPYTRGIYPTMYLGRPWTMRQYSGYATAKQTNQRYHYLLQHGQTGLSVAFDLPTQMGYDSDAEMAAGEIGKVGVPVSTLEDMQALFANIPLDKVSVSMTINSTCPVILAMFLVMAEKNKFPVAALSGTVQNDVLKEYFARGTYIFPPGPSMKLAVDVFEYCTKNAPKWNFISVSGYHIREAGSNAVQELAFTLADGICYVDEAVKRGLNVDEFAGRLSFFFNAHNNFFEEIAKYRAARRMWANIMKNRFNAQNPKSMLMRFHTQTGGCTLTAQQPDNNVVRVALQALGAVLGGTQSLHTNSKDEALCLPTEDSVRLALRTQQVLAYETGVTDVIDPFGGSYYVECLTNELERRAYEYINKIDRLGGAVKAIEAGFFKKEIEQSAYEYQKAVEKNEQIVVGVNAYQDKENGKDVRVKRVKVDERAQKDQLKRLVSYKKKRDIKAVDSRLAALRSVAEKNTENLMPYIIDSVKASSTLGEIVGTLKNIYGEYR
ncbi:MAG: methylmalonyl-CoA mutase [Planctomycetes bacterium]|nr:methylmalonyl-CoA mutase [Planctomycetota bacterium]